MFINVYGAEDIKFDVLVTSSYIVRSIYSIFQEYYDGHFVDNGTNYLPIKYVLDTNPFYHNQ